MISLVYLFAFLSGSAALMYEVVWFRSLSLVFGGAHLAVTTTVSVFMAGLALGSWFGGKHLHRFRNLLVLYGFLELGIAFFALFFLLLMNVYPVIYVFCARYASESTFYLTFIRIIFAILAMIVPTTLMGATIPVLTAVVTDEKKNMARHLSFLYGFNTLGAVAGVSLAGFYLLTVLPVHTVVYLGMSLNVIIGVLSIICRKNQVGSRKMLAFEQRLSAAEVESPANIEHSHYTALSKRRLLQQFVMVGVGLSGFCALGYEVLWTRVLVLFIDGSTYGFTLMLVAFLLGISMGGMSYGIFRKVFFAKKQKDTPGEDSAACWFGAVQILIGMFTLLSMNLIFYIPAYWILLQKLFYNLTGTIFSAQQLGNFFIEFSLLLVPSFFMGLAIPLAVKVNSYFRHSIGMATGEVLSYNTVGSILGGAVSGFGLIYILGIERSFYFLITINVGFGVMVIARAKKLTALMSVAATVLAGILVLLISYPDFLQTWDAKYLATYSQNTAPYYSDRNSAKSYMDSLEMVYYAEGRESIVSTVFHKDAGLLRFATNGRIEATTQLEDVQLQYLLGHLPMLLHKNPEKVLNVGLGSGMSLGAISVHPELELLKLVEIEPKVKGVARSFADWNHNVLESPKLHIVINDARNYLLTSDEKFDVIAMDPLQPYWRGSGYLYTTEYFRLVASHLAEGGIACQYLPLYHISVDNMKSIVRSFRENFKHVMIWVTLADVELIGSNSPIYIDEKRLQERLAASEEIRNDLGKVMMGSVQELLTYFMMGTRGADTFSGDARINTDDNVYIEFSAPKTIGDNTIESKNFTALSAYRESIVPYLVFLDDAMATYLRNSRWEWDGPFNVIADRGQALYLQRFQTPGQITAFTPELEKLPNMGRWLAVKTMLGAGLQEKTNR